MGFRRGVKKTTQGLIHGRVDESFKATENVNCSGSEERLDGCSILHNEGDKPCKLSEDIVSVTCVPDSWAVCRQGEIPWGDQCYEIHLNASGFYDAQEVCRAGGKHLLEVDTQEENDMVSELLFQNR